MTLDAMNRAVTNTVLILVVGALLLWLASLVGCAGIWESVRSSAWPAGGAAGGAVVGSLAGPVGTVGGAAAGAVVGHSLEENASLRSGDLAGGEALEREIERWKGKADHATAAAASIQNQKDDLMSILAASFAAIYVIRNRHWWAFLFSSQSKGYRLEILLHTILGGKPPVIPPQFIKDVASRD